MITIEQIQASEFYKNLKQGGFKIVEWNTGDTYLMSLSKKYSFGNIVTSPAVELNLKFDTMEWVDHSLNQMKQSIEDIAKKELKPSE